VINIAGESAGVGGVNVNIVVAEPENIRSEIPFRFVEFLPMFNNAVSNKLSNVFNNRFTLGDRFIGKYAPTGDGAAIETKSKPT
jgi:hypothetical protein